MSRRGRQVTRVLLALLAISALFPGVWALVAPHGFFDAFPGGRHWLRALPPYNQHLATDVGAFYVAFGLMFVWAALRIELALVAPLCIAWVIFSAIHLVFHVVHLGGFATVDAVTQTASLTLVLAEGLAVLWLIGARARSRS